MKLSGTKPDQMKISPFGISKAFQSVSYNLVFIDYCLALFFNNSNKSNAATPNNSTALQEQAWSALKTSECHYVPDLVIFLILFLLHQPVLVRNEGA